ncbi:hypothetical protein pb186bvf_021100 [Paramecium bursaria]
MNINLNQNMSRNYLFIPFCRATALTKFQVSIYSKGLLELSQQVEQEQ